MPEHVPFWSNQIYLKFVQVKLRWHKHTCWQLSASFASSSKIEQRMGKKYQKSFPLPTCQKGVWHTNVGPRTRKIIGAIEPGATVMQHNTPLSHVNLNSGKLMQGITIAFHDWFSFSSKVWGNLVRSSGRPSRILSGKPFVFKFWRSEGHLRVVWQHFFQQLPPYYGSLREWCI